MNKSRVLLVAFLLAAGAAHAEPYLAVRMGLKCVQCHVNPTGGGLRNTYGNVFAQSTLAARRLGENSPPWTGLVGKYLAIGADLRADESYAHVNGQGTTQGFDLQEARLYLDLGLIPGRLSLYIDERVAPGDARNLEANLRLWLQPGRWYLKAGQFYLPFAWRLEDDNAFVRQLSGINMQTPDRGAELGLEAGRWSAQLALSNGSAGGPETDQGKQLTARVEYVPGNWRVGVSAMNNDSDVGDKRGAGVFAGWRWRKLALLGELDYFDDAGIGIDGRRLMASLAEVNWLLRPGQNLKASYEWFEPDRRVSEDEQTRSSLVYEWSPLQFIQARFGVRKYLGIPQNDFQNRTEAFVQLHGYF
jgi:hypothetical protein